MFVVPTGSLLVKLWAHQRTSDRPSRMPREFYSPCCPHVVPMLSPCCPHVVMHVPHFQQSTTMDAARATAPTNLLQPLAVLNRGLQLLNLDNEVKLSVDQRRRKFKQHYGSQPLVIAAQWYDLCHATNENGERLLTAKDVKRGFKMFMVAHYFLYNYTRSSHQLGDHFGICESYARGEHLWGWVRKIAFLEKRVIFWPKILDSPESEVNVLSVDGVDKKTFERKHKTQLLPIDRGNCSHKHAHGAVKYQITLAAHRASTFMARCAAGWATRRCSNGLALLQFFLNRRDIDAR